MSTYLFGIIIGFYIVLKTVLLLLQYDSSQFVAYTFRSANKTFSNNAGVLEKYVTDSRGRPLRQ